MATRPSVIFHLSHSLDIIRIVLYIDDIRNPNYDAVVVRTSKEAISYVKENGCPNFISFDHDLGGDDTAMIFVKWLVNHDLDNGAKIIPVDFRFNVHSANPSGAANIKSYLDNYLKVRNE